MGFGAGRLAVSQQIPSKYVNKEIDEWTQVSTSRVTWGKLLISQFQFLRE
jgi:hypothetical protein